MSAIARVMRRFICQLISDECQLIAGLVIGLVIPVFLKNLLQFFHTLGNVFIFLDIAIILLFRNTPRATTSTLMSLDEFLILVILFLELLILSKKLFLVGFFLVFLGVGV